MIIGRTNNKKQTAHKGIEIKKMNKLKQRISSAVLEARKKRGFTQIEMAKRLGVARQTYLDIERGKTSPKACLLYEISDITNFPITYFYGSHSDSCSISNTATAINSLEQIIDLLKEEKNEQNRLNS